jgi:hypothetical protein
MLKRIIAMLAMVLAIAACGDQGSPPGSLVTPAGGAPSQPVAPSASTDDDGDDGDDDSADPSSSDDDGGDDDDDDDSPSPS